MYSRPAGASSAYLSPTTVATEPITAARSQHISEVPAASGSGARLSRPILSAHRAPNCRARLAACRGAACGAYVCRARDRAGPRRSTHPNRYRMLPSGGSSSHETSECQYSPAMRLELASAWMGRISG